MKLAIRHRLVTIIVLGVLTWTLSVFALVQLLSTNTANRVERARDAMLDEVAHLARTPTRAGDRTPTTLVGLHAGIWVGEERPRALSPDREPAVRRAVEQARSSGARVVSEAPSPEGTVIVAAIPVENEPSAIVFGTYIVRPLPSIVAWRRIVSLLVGATVLLVATATYSIVTLSRGAAELRKSLDALATDLHASVPRPSVRELGEIAEGIATLAAKLADARSKEERLAQELAQRERLAALGRVAAGVAHEVRNPLASIKLRLDLAAAAAKLPVAVEEAVAHATSEISRLDRLVADLLFAAGRAVGPKATLDVGALVRGRAEALTQWAAERKVALETTGAGAASIDSDAMARAIDNLLRNAIEASAEGGQVVTRVSTERDRVVVAVEDRGPGVPAERATELFEPFFTTKPDGTGLGLAISRAIARGHGGDLVYDRKGAVTRFVLSIDTASAPPKKATASDSDGNRRFA
ncbi:MAG TPA: ATP-binding protein [Polyangiaceae bacterium]|nr:ATP-binding protein [Polyangiaceae bacterium]